jgi:predicted extracellular nuclease
MPLSVLSTISSSGYLLFLRSTFTLLMASLVCAATVFSAPITEWSFTGDVSTPSAGNGSILLVGGTTATFASGLTGGADRAYNTTTYPSLGVANKTAGIEFSVSTLGQQNIQFEFDLRHSNTSANTVSVQYSTDGTNFIEAKLVTFVPAATGTGDTWNPGTGLKRAVNLGAVTALNNNANAKFRVVSAFDVSAANYLAARAAPASTYAGGTMRYDNVVVSGDPILTTDMPPTIVATVPVSGATNVAVTTPITVNFSEVINFAAGAVTLVCGSPGISISLGSTSINNVTSISLVPVSALPNSSSCTITVSAAGIVDVDGTPNAMVSDYVSSFTTAAVISGNTAPTIIPAAGMNPRLSIAVTSPAFVSGVIADPTDPASVTGISFVVADAETAVADLTVTALSSNVAVVPNANIVVSGSGATRNVKITPVASGIAAVTVAVSDGVLSTNFVINYAASIASVSPANSRFTTGACDASSAIAIDANALLIANDEDQRLRLYPRGASGFNATQFDFTTSLALTDLSGGAPREVDLEASTRVGNRIYWIGSHSNSSGGSARPNRSRLYATDASGAGTAATLTFVGYYGNLKTDLIAWDSGNVHGLGANAFGFAASAAPGVLPDANDGSGFNIEALTIAPDGATAYLAFRGPLATAATRNRALIVPVTNFAALIGGAGPATFGAPIQLDLGGRAIRSVERNAANQYLILAGPAGAATGVAPADFRLYKWSGVAADAPELFATDLTARGVVGSFEGIVEVPNPLQAGARVELLVDTGDTNFYGTGACKDLPNVEHKKARIEAFDLISPATRIHAVQGSGAASPVVGQTVTVEGIVTADFQAANQLGGFYVQEPDPLKDSDPLTSEGIFVAGTATSVAVGDLVKVTGVVSESFGLTQIGGLSLSVSVMSSGNALPAIIDIALPAAASTTNTADWVRYEGMRVRFPQTLTVTENFNLAQFGELVLADGRQIQPTNTVDPNDNPSSGNNTTTTSGNTNVASVTAAQRQNTLNRIVLDDASGVSNPAVIPYWDSTNNTLRVGTTVAGVTGIMSYGFSAYRIQPTLAPTFNFATRPITPPDVGVANVKVASFNVLNYFNGDGAGGGFPTSRGATTAPEFVRQKAKIVAAINTMNADVVGLMEMENDGSGAASAIADLVASLNLSAGAGTWSYVNDPANLGSTAGGTDAIKVAIIYKSAAVVLDRAALLCDDPAFSNGRTPTAQTFRSVANNGRFTIVVNHFKSKNPPARNSPPPADADDTDQNDGQGWFNSSRRKQATALSACITNWKNVVGDDDFVVLGDLNAYAQEDPVDVLRAAGNTVLDESGYSYVFNGQSGALDHTLVSASLLTQVTGAAAWHINADEPRILDYNVDFKNTPGCTSGTPPGAACTSPDYYVPTPFRSSDHDPVLIGLNLTADAINLSFDIDGNGRCDATNDPILLVRYLMGFRDDALTSGLTTTRTLAQITAHLTGLGIALDIDDDGATHALTDGLMFTRYVLTLTGPALTANARNSMQGGGIKSDADIKQYLDNRCAVTQ